MEGILKGSIELKPLPYNIVLKDGTYAGELKVGIKFNSNVSIYCFYYWPFSTIIFFATHTNLFCKIFRSLLKIIHFKF